MYTIKYFINILTESSYWYDPYTYVKWWSTVFLDIQYVCSYEMYLQNKARLKGIHNQTVTFRERKAPLEVDAECVEHQKTLQNIMSHCPRGNCKTNFHIKTAKNELQILAELKNCEEVFCSA